MRTALCLLLVAGVASAQSTTLVNLTAKTGLPVQRLELDWPHSAVEFSVGFMGLSKVHGAFGSFGGTLMLDTVDANRSTITVIISTASINTNVAFRDQHPKSADFFDAEKYPWITFRSERIERAGDHFVVHGPLTMHGVTKVVAIPFRQLHPLSSDAWSNKRIGLLGNVTLKRSDFAIKGTAFWNSEFDPGRMSISDDVEVSLMISAKVNNVEKWTNAAADSLLTNISAAGVSSALEGFRPRLADTTVAARSGRAALLDNVGVKLMQRGRFQEAVAVYSFLAANAPKMAASATASEAEAHLMLGHRDVAVRGFERAAALDSLNTVAAEYLRVLRAH